MTPEQENQLRRLLKLKRYEQPPPGYFNNFSRQVMARVAIRVANDREPLMERLFRAAPWVQRFVAVFEAKPALAGSFGAAVCALLIGGVIFSEKMESAPASFMPVPTETADAAVAPSPIGLRPLAEPATLVSSTNPVIQPGRSLFDQIDINPQSVQPASFQP
jgi:hypothetical protein